jgi:hypothetical protein
VGEEELRLSQAIEALAYAHRVKGGQLFRAKLDAHLIYVVIGVGNCPIQRRLEVRARRIAINDESEVDSYKSREASLDRDRGERVCVCQARLEAENPGKRNRKRLARQEMLGESVVH